MSNKTIRPYGTWSSPITTDLIVSSTIGLGEIQLQNGCIYWIEMRPEEKGRYVVVMWQGNDAIRELTPDNYNARSLVHEYGGGSYFIAKDTVYFSNFRDQRLYCCRFGQQPEPLTPEADRRYADGFLDKTRHRFISVLEDHGTAGDEPRNSLVAIPLDSEQSDLQILAEGADFYSNPRLSHDGCRMSWICWNHPDMPWDNTELWVAEISVDGSLVNQQKIAGGDEESIFQPEWSTNGHLYFISDRSGWWNLYQWDGATVEPIVEMEAEFGVAQWSLRESTYDFISANEILCTYSQDGISHLARVNLTTRELMEIPTPYTDIEAIQADQTQAVFMGASPARFPEVVRLDLASQQFEVLKRSSKIMIDAENLSVGESIEFATENQQTAHGFYYPPNNKDYEGPADELPPLIVCSHGGPTGMARNGLKMVIQYFTSRGFAVLDVNYGGSSGFGRAFRQRLNGQWGLVDVDDCVNGALCLVQQGKVDPNRLIIRGGSAGGFTTLAALTFRDVFKAGASRYGVSDLEALAKETHKFESRYLDRLVGPYPQARQIYQERSPIHSVDRLSCPVIFFQGLEDKIVLPNQAEMMVDALRRNGLPVAYVPFANEQHGFRQAENIKRALDGELYFFARVFGFEPADRIEPIAIDNL